MPLPWQATHWSNWLQQSNRLGHAYLLTGAEGIGLTDFAYAMAQGVLCIQPGIEPCNHCAQCHQFRQRTHPDFFHVKVAEDKKEISVDQIRDLSQKIYTTSHQGGFKVALLEAVETLNASAFNALLKTLEEPPAQTLLILTAHHVGQLPATVISRCRQIAFATPMQSESMAWLQHQLPQADVPLLKKALKNNWGAPLSARQWIENKGFELEAAWQADMKALQQGQQTASQLAEKWKKWEAPERILDYFYLWSVTMIRASQYQQKLPFNPNWLQFQKMVLQARRFWHQNVNKELLLETVCSHWLQHQLPGYVPTDLFDGHFVRSAQV